MTSKNSGSDNGDGTSLQQFRADVIHGLGSPHKQLSPKYLYDEAGSQLFDRICELEEYYPTRTELAIMEQNVVAMTEAIGEGALLIEYGSGSSLKTRLLLDEAADHLAGYVPVDISGDHLANVADELDRRYPGLKVIPVHADFTTDFDIPTIEPVPTRRVLYFPGSTIGNFEKAQAVELLSGMARIAQPGGGLLLGLDLKKDVGVLERAYNDSEGVTAEFILNLLRRINNELGADFDVDSFHLESIYNSELECVELFLVCDKAQTVGVGEYSFAFRHGERILAERSHKYDVAGFSEWVRPTGFEVKKGWTDENNLFTVQYLEVTS